MQQSGPQADNRPKHNRHRQQISLPQHAFVLQRVPLGPHGSIPACTPAPKEQHQPAQLTHMLTVGRDLDACRQNSCNQWTSKALGWYALPRKHVSASSAVRQILCLHAAHNQTTHFGPNCRIPCWHVHIAGNMRQASHDKHQAALHTQQHRHHTTRLGAKENCCGCVLLCRWRWWGAAKASSFPQLTCQNIKGTVSLHH